MRQPLHTKFVDKAHSALVAAVEIYNKPSFSYREETFCLLALNAWELLLKAIVLKLNDSNLRSIRVYEPRKLKGGGLSSKHYLKRNRVGNPMTISFNASALLLETTEYKLPSEVRANLIALLSIRDSSAHYINASPVLCKQVMELAVACIKNFVILTNKCFDRDLAQSLSFMLPLSFVGGSSVSDSVVVSKDESRLIDHLGSLSNQNYAPNSLYSVAIRVDVKLEKSSLKDASKVQLSRDPDAVKITLSEADIREKYPWDYAELLKRLSGRYSDFKANSDFHSTKKPLMSNERYVKSRFLDPGNPKSQKKDFYSPNILPEFDWVYSQKKK